MRMIRDFTSSDKMKNLSANAERFFIRLLCRIDDYGNILYDMHFLLRELFPKHTSIRAAELTRWVADCKQAGILCLYEVMDKTYIHVPEFRQKLRWPTNKYPLPSWQALKEKSTKKEKDVDVEGEGERELSAPALFLKKKPELWNYAIDNFDKYFPEMVLNLNKKSRTMAQNNIEAEEAFLRKTYVTEPLENEIHKFYNYYASANFLISKNNPIKQWLPLWTKWLIRKLEHQR